MGAETTRGTGGVAVGTEAKEFEDMATETETTKEIEDMVAAMKEDYQTNESFRKYVDKFISNKDVTPEVALTHQVVKDVWEGRKKENEGVWRGTGS